MYYVFIRNSSNSYLQTLGQHFGVLETSTIFHWEGIIANYCGWGWRNINFLVRGKTSSTVTFKEVSWNFIKRSWDVTWMYCTCSEHLSSTIWSPSHYINSTFLTVLNTKTQSAKHNKRKWKLYYGNKSFFSCLSFYLSLSIYSPKVLFRLDLLSKGLAIYSSITIKHYLVIFSV